jgi:hypothetical protein
VISEVIGERKEGVGVQRLGGEPLWSVPSWRLVSGDCVVRRKEALAGASRELLMGFHSPQWPFSGAAC